MKPAFDEVAVICPDAVTGGPEAIHQLAHAINAMGGRCGVAYFGGKSTVALVDNAQGCSITCACEPDLPAATAFRQYRPHIISEMPLNGRTLLILPEVIADTARQPRLGRHAVWWLSVDDAIFFNPRLGEQSYRDEYFSDELVIYFYQSDYARDFLVRNGARQVYPLFDYTDDIFLQPPANAAARQKRIAYFPRKGAELAAELMAAAPEQTFMPIENMTREQVRETLAGNPVYIDFGHHPGKVGRPGKPPRPARLCCCTTNWGRFAFCRPSAGAAVPVQPGDIRDGGLAARLRDILADHPAHAARQRSYRRKIRLEKQESHLQVQSFFFDEDAAGRG